MSMLAERRQKQKWTLNPRGKWWTEDSNKFGQRMLEKMGWTKGKGLGINEQGITECFSMSHKNDITGVGYDKNFEVWTEHQEKFGNFLQQLNGNQDQGAVKNQDANLSGQSIELKSKQSHARVHYKKFTRGKDINKYKPKDLANIFGQKELAEKTPIKVEKGDNIRETEASDFKKDWYGVDTVNRGSMVDYFKHKSNYNNMSDYSKCNVKSNNDTRSSSNMIDNRTTDSESENDQHVGFGFTSKIEDTSLPSYGTLKDSDDKSNYAFDNPCLGLNSPTETAYDTNGSSVKSTKKKKKEFESDSLHITEVDKYNTRKKSKTEIIDSDCKNGFINPALNLDTKLDCEKDCNNKEFEVFRAQLGLENCSGFSAKSTKKRKKEFESDSLHITEVNKHNIRKKLKTETIDSDCKSGFINPALNLDTKPEEDCNGKKFEVFRTQFENCGLDLTDERNNKKRVTFNDHIMLYEYNINSAKKKKGEATLDKFEVENKKSKKKRKRESITTPVTNGFVNEALDVQILHEEINDNELNEHRNKKIKKRKIYKTSSLETIQESPEKEIIEITIESEDTLDTSIENKEINTVEQQSKKKKKKKEKKEKRAKVEDVTVLHVINEETDIEIVETIINKKIKKDKESKEEEETTISKKCKKKKKKNKESCKSEKRIIQTEINNEQDIMILDKSDSKQQNDLIENENKDAAIIETLPVSTTKEEEEKEEGPLEKIKHKKKKRKSISKEDDLNQQDIKISNKSDSKQQNDLIENENKYAAIIETLPVCTTKEEEEKEGSSEKIKHKKKKRKSISKEDCSRQIDVSSVEREISDKENTDKERDPNTQKISKKDKKSKKSKDKNVSDDVGDSSNPNKEVVDGNVIKQDKIENAEFTDTPSKKSKVINVIDNVINSPWSIKARMSKKMLITLFHNNAILEFPGSNVHNIKGYGTDECDL